MKIAEYIATFLVEKGITTCFSVTGGFAMHLNDQFGEKMSNVVYTHGENPAGYAALGWSSYNHTPSVCCVTSGCGATNAITPCLIAYQDSVPVFFISGQVHQYENVRSLKHTVRGYFGSDCDIVSALENITKCAIELTDTTRVRTVLEECYWNLTTGRLGPVWLSVPVDVQSIELNYSGPEYSIPEPVRYDTVVPPEFYDIWRNAKRPLVLAGNGIHLSKTKEQFLELVKNVPFVVSFFGSDLSDEYIGKVGLIGNRSGNFALQNCDVLLCLGCRLSKSITGYNRVFFAPKSKILYVDIDTSECTLERKKIDVALNMDLKSFFGLYQPHDYSSIINPEWLVRTKKWKQNWSRELPPVQEKCPYRALDDFFTNKPDNSVVVASSGSLYCATWHMYKYKPGDRFITSGHGDMGYELPVSIGASLHSKRVYCLVGDGSLQLNIQELQTLKTLQAPVTVMVFNNGGYGAIKITQNNIFRREFGTTVKSGLECPDIKKVAEAYGVPYLKFTTMDTLLETQGKGPLIVEIECVVQERFPKISNKINEDGTFTNMGWEQMAPFLTDEELKTNMF